MDHWDDWVTDRTVTLQQMNDFMHDKDNIGRKWQGKYMVATTSGSTGNPLVMLCDKTVNNVMAAVSASRSYARKKDMSAFIRKGGKSMGVYADSGFYLGNSTIRSKLLMMPWKKRQFGLSSALWPTEKIVEQLNRFQPAMLGGYPSNLEFEAPEYSQEGIDHFRTSLEDQERIRKLTFYGSFDGDKLVGTLCMGAPQHIGGFFVDAAYHRRGIGRRLFQAMRQDYARQVFTVNSSPYAEEVYRHLGFTQTDREQTVDGLRFTPMQYDGERI